MRFANKVLLVTGGASGIGAATARRYTAEGGRVAVVDLDLAKAEATAAEIPGAIAVQCDVSDEPSVIAAVAQTREQLGRIDHVFNAAGHVAFGRVEKFPVDAWNKLLAVHVTGTFLVTRTAIPAMREAGGGAVVNIASISAIVARAHTTGYAAAKGAIIGMSRQLALDLAPDNIRVNVVIPGSVLTPMTSPLWAKDGDAEGDINRAAASSAGESIQNRVADPEEVAAPVLFLLSDDASFITGSQLVPDGGMTAI